MILYNYNNNIDRINLHNYITSGKIHRIYSTVNYYTQFHIMVLKLSSIPARGRRKEGKSLTENIMYRNLNTAIYMQAHNAPSITEHLHRMKQ